ncbi:MAG: aminotransferase class V-fold PLP-dependent enzyme [Deltaproteobacteria bacterium]
MDRQSRIIYLDNAATSFPKPPEVLQEMLDTYSRLGVSPGRGSYDLASQCEQLVHTVRQQISDFFGGDGPERVIFAYNSTDALNTVIHGLMEPGCHVVSSRLEHNSVLRPLHYLREHGLILLDLVPFDGNGFIDPQDVARAIEPSTRFVILNHASNVFGTIQPVSDVGRICAEHEVPLVLDVSQSAGIVPIDMGVGGTGSESWSMAQPQDYPRRLEAGTLNTLGIIGLSAGMRYILQRDMANIYRDEMSLARTLRDGLASIKGVRLYCAHTLENHVAVLTCNVEDLDPEDFAAILDGDFDIATRAGLHCAPLVHKDLGTSPRGSVRFSPGPLNTGGDVSAAVEAVQAIVANLK